MISFGKTIPVRVHPLFWLMAGVLGYISGKGNLVLALIWIGIIFVSVLVHEFGHALTAIAYGQRASIDLVALGGLTQRQGKPLSFFREFVVVINGPLAGFALMLVAGQLHAIVPESSPVLLEILSATFWVNLVWTVVNLLPVQPLDGGKLLMIVLEAAFGLKGVKIGFFASVVIGVCFALFFFAIGALLPGAIFLMLAFESYRTWQGSLVMTEKDRDEDLQHQLHSAEQFLVAGNRPEAERLLKDVRAKVQSGFLYLTATELLGQLSAENGDYTTAYDLLKSIEPHLSETAIPLLHQLAYRTGQWEDAIEIGTKAHQNAPSYETAVINAIAHAVKGEVEPAVGWLRCALDEGLPNVQTILRQHEFDGIRANPQFVEFEAELPAQ